MEKRAKPEAVRSTFTRPGRPLDQTTRSEMETRFAHDFSRVRVHTDERAAGAARGLHASAFTYGNDIGFDAGQYDPQSARGRELLAHELSHVVQQRAGVIPGDMHERRADQAAQAVSHGAAASPMLASYCAVASTAAAPVVQRRPAAVFPPALGTKNTALKGKFGDFSIDHGLTVLPAGGAFGEYSIKITMTPNAKTGTSKIGFLQVYRQGKTGGGWAKKEGENFLTADEAKRTEKLGGWAVDRADPARDKTPLYGMFKDAAGALQQHAHTTLGEHGGTDPVLSDKPQVADPDRMQFTSTAMDVDDGTRYGAIAWGFEYDSAKKVYKEETPKLLGPGARLAGRNRAMRKWDKVVATPASGIDKIPD
ncbi:MAG: DUF4157 domain-containing protein [Thermoanaerobaculia bacterium]